MDLNLVIILGVAGLIICFLMSSFVIGALRHNCRQCQQRRKEERATRRRAETAEAIEVPRITVIPDDRPVNNGTIPYVRGTATPALLGQHNDHSRNSRPGQNGADVDSIELTVLRNSQITLGNGHATLLPPPDDSNRQSRPSRKKGEHNICSHGSCTKQVKSACSSCDAFLCQDHLADGEACALHNSGRHGDPETFYHGTRRI